MSQFVNFFGGHLVYFYCLAAVGMTAVAMRLHGYFDRKVIIVKKSTYLAWYRSASAEGKPVEQWLIEMIGVEEPSGSSGLHHSS